MLRKLLLGTCGLIPFAANSQQLQRTTEKPNVILLLVDDLGWRDLGFMGSKYYETPNIDKLSRHGVVFSNAYASCAVCSPTRASIQTGKYPARLGITDWIRARFQVSGGKITAPPKFDENEGQKLRTPANPFWMELKENTIAEYLKKSGYFTCHIGKWHLGTDDYYPEKQGYDLNIAGCDMGQPVNYFDPYTNDDGVGFPTLPARKKGEYLEDRLADEIDKVIQDHKDQPFFINMCYYAVHTPLMAKQELIDKYKAKGVTDKQNNPIYAAMLEHLDNSVGRLVGVLERNHLIDNTVIIFTSDNGGLIGSTDNSPLRSGKGFSYEGGIRVPLFVFWKNKIQPGSTCDVPVSSIDWLPTICSVTKTPYPAKEIDGRDISPLLKGKKLDQIPLFWHFPHYRGGDVPYSIIRDGDWKLIKRYEGHEFELFNLKEDISETTDLSAKYPERVAKLNSELKIWLKNVNAKLPEVK